jgi:pimeloyl-ACP methyl ester carboxylesterase
MTVPTTGRHTVELRHAKSTLALHRLREGADRARPLLVLHGLGERTPPAPPPYLDAWTGAVWGLDFTGHGASSRPRGGGYTAEILLGDADAAIGHLGRATVFGRGLGAYVALLLAGARTGDVRGAILADGPGLAGGGSSPASPLPLMPVPTATSPEAPDPFALAELARDVRPPDYAVNYARLTLQFSGLDEPLAVVSRVHTPWLDAVAAEPGVVTVSIVEAIRRFARVE